MDETHGRYRFGTFTFDSVTGELAWGGEVVRLAPKPAHVLRVLLEEAGELVSRDLLTERVWPDTVIEFDKGLNFCIHEVRTALGDEAASPTYIETLPRRGYRFIQEVEALGPNPRVGAEGGDAVAGVSRPGWAVRLPLLVAAVAASILWMGLSLRSGDVKVPDPRAREAFEMGAYLLNRGEGDDVERSIPFLEEAIGLAPDYARAHAALGSAYLRLSRAGEGKEALRRSLELDAAQWRPHLVLGQRALYVEHAWEEARPHFQAALDLAPDEVVVRHTHAWTRAVSGDLEGALREMHAALELDPVSPRVNGDVGRLFYLAGRHEEAVEQCRRTLRLLHDVLRSRDCIVHALAAAGDPEGARAEALVTMSEHGASPAALAPVRGRAVEEALAAYWRWAGATIGALAEEGKDSHVHAAAAWARAGDRDRAAAALEAAYAVRCPILLQIHLDPAFSSLSGDPRFETMLRRIDLPTAS